MKAHNIPVDSQNLPFSPLLDRLSLSTYIRTHKMRCTRMRNPLLYISLSALLFLLISISITGDKLHEVAVVNLSSSTQPAAGQPVASAAPDEDDDQAGDEEHELQVQMKAKGGGHGSGGYRSPKGHKKKKSSAVLTSCTFPLQYVVSAVACVMWFQLLHA